MTLCESICVEYFLLRAMGSIALSKKSILKSILKCPSDTVPATGLKQKVRWMKVLSLAGDLKSDALRGSWSSDQVKRLGFFVSLEEIFSLSTEEKTAKY